MSDFLYWAEPQPVWVEDGMQLLVGGGEVTGGPSDGQDRAFLCVQSVHASAFACLSARALDELIPMLTDIRKAMEERS